MPAKSEYLTTAVLVAQITAARVMNAVRRRVLGT